MNNIQNHKRNKTALDFFLLSVIFFQVGRITRVEFGIQSLGNGLRIIGFIILVYSLLMQFSSKNKSHLNGIMIFLILWNTINILYSIFSTGLNHTRTFGEDSYFFNFIMPYLLLYNVQSFNIKKVFKYCIAFAFLSLLIVTINYKYILNANNISTITEALDAENMSLYFAQLPLMWSIPASLIFMNTQFVKNKQVVIALATVMLATMLSMAFGRRGTSFYGFAFLAVGAYTYIKNPYISVRKRRNFKIAVFLLLIVAITISTSHFSFLMERGMEDSRTGINEAFYADMNTIDYIFGRGLNGTYYDPLIIFEAHNFQRPALETGYLNIILHAGLLYLIPYLLLCLTSVYYGLFKSRNTFVKSFAVYILLNTLMLYIGSYPEFNLRFFLLWIGILLCNNRLIRSMNNDEIKSFYKLSAR